MVPVRDTAAQALGVLLQHCLVATVDQVATSAQVLAVITCACGCGVGKFVFMFIVLIFLCTWCSYLKTSTSLFYDELK